MSHGCGINAFLYNEDFVKRLRYTNKKASSEKDAF
jgi:hypothetical protein